MCLSRLPLLQLQLVDLFLQRAQLQLLLPQLFSGLLFVLGIELGFCIGQPVNMLPCIVQSCHLWRRPGSLSLPAVGRQSSIGRRSIVQGWIIP